MRLLHIFTVEIDETSDFFPFNKILRRKAQIKIAHKPCITLISILMEFDKIRGDKNGARSFVA